MKKEILHKFLRSEASDTEIQELLRLLHEPEKDFDEYLSERWECAEGVIPAHTDLRMQQHIRQSIRPRSRSIHHKIWAAAAILLIVLLSGVSIYQRYELKTATQYADMIITVPKAQKNQLQLPDGTRIWLNSDSQLKYGTRFNGHERLVELTGEAYFEVAKNPDAPFTVLAGGISVTALGTSFNIKAYPSEKAVTTYLAEGKVSIQSATESMFMIAGECMNYHYISQRMEKTTAANDHSFMAWHHNQLVFEDESLENIARLLERQYNVQIDIRDEKLKTYSYNGTLENTGLINILDLLALTSPLAYEYKDNTVILSIKKSLK